jgi:CubicO group peptidase (beta-lactamase class C family)
MKKYLVIISILFFSFTIGCNSDPSQSVFVPYTWNVSTPEAEGFNTQVLDSAFEKADQLDFIDALLVIRNGNIVAELYYNGFSDSTPHTVMSVSKNFLSAICGIAFERGYLDSLEETMLDYFPEYIYTGIERRKYDITIRHLLTMRMGLDYERNNYFQLYNSDNWVGATIEFPLTYSPGERFSYNTFQTHLLSAIITKATNMSTMDFASRFLTGPMGITIDDWETDPQGIYFGGNTMHFTPREMAVLGYLYLHYGRLNDIQIVPRDWIELTLSPSTENTSNEWGVLKNYNYAHLWWLGQINDNDFFMAIGHGGQFVAVCPALNLIVVSTANNNVDWDTANDQEQSVLEIISKYILPAVNN